MNLFKKILGDDGYDDDTMEETEATGYLENEDLENLNLTAGGKPKPQFVLVKPDKRDDLLPIADNLLERKTVILNLELVKNDTHRFVDFLSGVAYALSGQVRKVAANTFLIIPGGLEISGDIFEDIENEF